MEIIGIIKLGGFGRYLGLFKKIGRKKNMFLSILDRELRIKWISWYNKYFF